MKIRHGPKIDFKYCKGCKKCYQECPADVFGWDDDRQLPIIQYPLECYYCSTCEIECQEEAIKLYLPLHVILDTGISPKERTL